MHRKSITRTCPSKDVGQEDRPAPHLQMLQERPLPPSFTPTMTWAPISPDWWGNRAPILSDSMGVTYSEEIHLFLGFVPEKNLHKTHLFFSVPEKLVRNPPGAQCTTPQARRSCPASLLPGIISILYSVLHGICNLALQVAVIGNINLGLHVICNLTLQIVLMRNINLG